MKTKFRKKQECNISRAKNEKNITDGIQKSLFVPYGWFKLCWYASHAERYSEEQRYQLLKYVDNRAVKGGNLVIDGHGMENIPKENGFIFFPNHQGLFDVLAIIQVCPVPFSVVAKKELTNVPFLKQVFACMKAFMIDRDDVKQSMQVIINVIKEVKAGRNYLILPREPEAKTAIIRRNLKVEVLKLQRNQNVRSYPQH